MLKTPEETAEHIAYMKEISKAITAKNIRQIRRFKNKIGRAFLRSLNASHIMRTR